MNFPDYRGRRVRRTEGLRRMVRETRLSVDNLCYPLFCAPGQGVQKPIASMPGQHVWSVDKAVDAAAPPTTPASRR
jgi:porphobilinogen synthase